MVIVPFSVGCCIFIVCVCLVSEALLAQLKYNICVMTICFSCILLVFSKLLCCCILYLYNTVYGAEIKFKYYLTHLFNPKLMWTSS